MSWSPVTMQWPNQATYWLDGLDEAKSLASAEMAKTQERLASMTAPTNPGPVGDAAVAAIEVGRAAMTTQLATPPACLTVTPFQSGMGQGRSYQKFLSAPNLLEELAIKLVDADNGRPGGEQFALCVLFLSTRFDQFAATLGRFNALLPTPDLVRAERRAMLVAKLEAEKWTLPCAESLPRWRDLPLERCTVTKASQQTLNSQLAIYESYAADSSPLADLAALATRKTEQQTARDQQLSDLQNSLANGLPEATMQARMMGPGDAVELRRQLLEGAAPGHEWVLCAGLLMLGSEESLSFVLELIGLGNRVWP
jgi:hypothetical protein